MVGSFAGRRARDPRMTTSSSLRKADVAVRIELGDVDVPVGQRLEPYRAEERLLRLDQQDRLREARIVEAAAKVYARLDRKYLELIDDESRPREVERIHDLGEIFADEHDVASPEGDAHPVPAGDVRHARDRALDPHSLASGLVCQTTDVHVERIAGLQTPGHDRLDGRAVGDGGNQHVGQACAITCCSTHVAEPERSEWSASTTGHAPRATASLASFTPWGMGCTVAVFSSASRRRHAKVATSSAALRASSGLPLVIAWTVMPTSGTSAKGKPKKTFI